jgi:hypothetical protein
MLYRVLAVVALIGSALWSWAQEKPPAGRKVVAPLRPILEVLHGANVSGSLELSRCGSAPLPHLPPLRDPLKSRGPLLQTLNEVFADDLAMHVTQDADRTTRMIEGGVPTDLLNVKISHIPFEINGVPLPAFSTVDAVRTILHTPEVLAFAEAHDIVIPPPNGAAPGSNAPYPMDRPHIVGSMNELTVSQAMDRVLKTFPGIWVYQDCPCADGKGRCVFFRFFDLHDPGLFWEE